MLYKIKSFFANPEVKGQALAQIPKVGISLFSTELGNKVFNSLIGLFGNIVNEWKGRGRNKEMLRSLFTNMMFTFADPTPNQIRELKRNVSDLVGGLRSKNFDSAFGSLLEEPQTVVSAVKSVMPNTRELKGKFTKSFANPLSRANDSVQEVSEDVVTTYRSAYNTGGISEDDLISY